MRILVISQEVWSDDQNGGNVLSNIFKHIKNIIGEKESVEFAQIFCSEGIPQNSICQNYYQMTDKMILANVLNKKNAVGNHFLKDCSHADTIQPMQDSFRVLKKMRFESFLVAKEILWKISAWENDSLKNFVTSFNPDIIFAPCYGWHYMLKLTRVVKEWTNKPVISYISDDFYSCKQFRFSPVYWINHMLLRRNVRKTFAVYDLVYTMTEEQKKQCEDAFGANMKILCKSANFSEVPIKENVGYPIRFVYAGNLFYNRWKTLKKLAIQIKELNTDEVKMKLDIYSNSVLSRHQLRHLDDGVNSCVHKAVSLVKLKQVYRESDIALHVEAFDLKNRLAVRLSFSTKIIDCLASGCAVMAICHKSQSGFNYLKRNRIAISCSNMEQLKFSLKKILNNPQVLCDIQEKAVCFGKRKHNDIEIGQELCRDFIYIVNLSHCVN